MRAAVISEPGLRETMEDAYFLDTNFRNLGEVFAGIYDGHSGRYAAVYASENLHREFLSLIEKGVSPEKAFVESYESISSKLSAQISGATAVTVYIHECDGKRIITCANAGDSRAIVVNRHGAYQLTRDHRLDDEEERERILRHGGQIEYPYVIYRGMGLMPTRALGDEYFRPAGVISTPTVNSYEICADDIAVLAACDGLFDYMTNEEVASYVLQSNSLEKTLKELVDEVIFRRGGTDNITIIAIELH